MFPKVAPLLSFSGLEGATCCADGHLCVRRGLPQADGALPSPGHGGSLQLHPGPSPQVGIITRRECSMYLM